MNINPRKGWMRAWDSNRKRRCWLNREKNLRLELKLVAPEYLETAVGRFRNPIHRWFILWNWDCTQMWGMEPKLSLLYVAYVDKHLLAYEPETSPR